MNGPAQRRMFKRYLYLNYKSFTALKHRFGRRITATGWLVMCAAFIAASLGVDPTLSLSYQTFTFLTCLLIVSAVAASFSRTQLSVTRVLPKFGSAGEPLDYRILVQNKTRRFQRGLNIIDELPDPRPSLDEFARTPEPGEEKRNWLDRTYCYYRWRWLIAQNTRARLDEAPVPELPPGGVREIRARMVPQRRGFLRLAGASVAVPDPFGLFRSITTIPATQSLLILPKRYPVAPFNLPGTMKYQQGGVSLASSVGESEEFAALREYRNGDPLRRIHWKSFAKIGEPIVKEFQDEFFVRHALILDTFSPRAHSELFEEAVSVAASIAYTIQNQDSLLDLMFVGPEAYCFTTGRGVAHIEQMLATLASVQPCRDRKFDALGNLVLTHAAQLSGCICVLIDWDEPRQQLIKRLRLLGLPLLVFVVRETDAPIDAGPMVDQPENLRVLPLGRIAEKLSGL